MTRAECLVHPACKAKVIVNGVSICYECWNSGSAYKRPERSWIEIATKRYAKGLITGKELDNALATIAYHLVDDTIPVFI